MGQISSTYDSEIEDGGDFLSVLEDLLSCFGSLCLFSSRKRGRKRHRMSHNGGRQRDPVFEYQHHNVRKQYPELQKESAFHRYDHVLTDTADDSEINSDGEYTDVDYDHGVLGDTGSVKYYVEVKEARKNMKWCPQRMNVRAKVYIRLTNIPNVWTMWQQVANGLCVFGIQAHKDFLYVSFTNKNGTKYAGKEKYVRLMRGAQPMKNFLAKDDPRLFKLEYARERGKYLLFHMRSSCYLGQTDGDGEPPSLVLTDKMYAVGWILEQKQHAPR